MASLAFSPDGTQLASGTQDGTIRIWDLATRQTKILSQPAEVWDLAWSPDGKTLAAASAGNWVRLFETETFEQYRVLQGANGLVRTIAWSPDGQTLAAGAVLSNSDGESIGGDILIWDVETLRIIVRPLPQNFQPVRSVTFDPSGNTLVIGRDDGTITFWGVLSQQLLGSPFKAHNHRVMSIAFSPDGRYMISGSIDGTIGLWTVLAPTQKIAVSPSGDLLATSQGSIISLWDLSAVQTEPIKILEGHTNDILSLAFSPDEKTLVSSGKDNLILFWDIDTGKQTEVAIRTLSNVQTLQFRPDGTTLAGAGDSGRAQISNPLTGQVIFRLIDQEGLPVLKVQYNNDRKLLDIVRKDGSLITFALQSQEPSILQESILPSAQGGITSIALSPDGMKAAYFRVGGTEQTAALSNDRRAHGIELSSFNQSFDPTVNPNDIDFILVKATEGTQYVDPNFEKYLKQIQSVPLREAYHYFQGNQPWQAQADLFLSNVKDKGFHFYVLYLESPPNADIAQFLSDSEKWLQYVNDQVHWKVLFGASRQFLSEFGSSANWMKDWPLLVAQYPLEPNRDGKPTLPSGFTDWKIWNYTDKGDNTEFGTGSGGVYLEVFNGTPQDMGEWLGPNPFSILDRSTGTIIHPNVAVEINSTQSFTFNSDSTYLAATGDGSVFLLDAATGEEISMLNIGERIVYSLDFMPDSDQLVIGTDDGTVLLWDLSILQSSANIDLMINEVACSQVSQNFSTDQWTKFIGADVPYVPTCPNAPVP